MKIDVGRLNMMLARRCMALTDLRSGTSPQTLTRIMRGEEVMWCETAHDAHGKEWNKIAQKQFEKGMGK